MEGAVESPAWVVCGPIPRPECYSNGRLAEASEFGFYVGRKIWNQEIYNKLCEVMNKPVDTAFFPAYRA